jgi:hypothetical protein
MQVVCIRWFELDGNAFHINFALCLRMHLKDMVPLIQKSFKKSLMLFAVNRLEQVVVGFSRSLGNGERDTVISRVSTFSDSRSAPDP